MDADLHSYLSLWKNFPIYFRKQQALSLKPGQYMPLGNHLVILEGIGNLGYVDETSIMCEIATAAYRAGADIYLTYFARELAGAMARGLIG